MIQNLVIQNLGEVPLTNMASNEFKCEATDCVSKYSHENATIAWNLLDLHVRTVHPDVRGAAAAAAGNGPAMANKLKIQRPTISERETEPRWETFQYEWNNYKTYNGLETRDKVVMELKQCCDAKLGQKLLRDPEANHETETEEDFLKRVKKFAVITKSINAHRSEFGKLRQDRGELFVNWVGRLREKAKLCQWVQTGCDTTTRLARSM